MNTLCVRRVEELGSHQCVGWGFVKWVWSTLSTGWSLGGLSQVSQVTSKYTTKCAVFWLVLLDLLLNNTVIQWLKTCPPQTACIHTQLLVWVELMGLLLAQYIDKHRRVWISLIHKGQIRPMTDSCYCLSLAGWGDDGKHNICAAHTLKS